jgi:fatty acid desaturase
VEKLAPGASGLGLDRAAIRELSVRSNRPGAWHLAGHLAALGATSAAVAGARGRWWVAPAWIVDGLVLGHLFAAQHETVHRTAFRSPTVNRWVSTAAGALTAVAPTHFRHEHLTHHRFTQDPERDPELLEVPARRGAYLFTLSGWPYWSWTVQTYLLHARGRLAPGEENWLTPAAQQEVFREARVLGAAYLAVLLSGPLTGWWWAYTLWVVPRVVGEPAQRVIRLAEHAGRPQVADPAIGTRSLRTIAPLRWLAWNMPMHAEHHAYPSVPFHHLPALRRRIGAFVVDRDGGYLAAHQRIWRSIVTS